VSPAGKQFRPASRTRFDLGGLPPSAEEAAPDAETPRRQDVQTSPARPGATGGRTAFTWRLTADQALALDEMTLRLKRHLGRAKLDKAEMLAELVGLAGENSAVFGALVARMQEKLDALTSRRRDVIVAWVSARGSGTGLWPGVPLLADVMGRVVEDRAAPFVRACLAPEYVVAHSPAAFRGFLRRRADARLP